MGLAKNWAAVICSILSAGLNFLAAGHVLMRSETKEAKIKFDHPAVLIVRHGSTSFNKGGDGDRIKGVKFDLPLTKKGREEADETALTVGKYDIASVESSPLLRSIQTASAVGRETGLTPKPDKRLNPWDVGYLSGQKRTTVHDRIKYYIENPHKPVPEGEKYQTFFDKFNDKLISKMKEAESTQGKGHVLVTHSCGALAADHVINDKMPQVHTN